MQSSLRCTGPKLAALTTVRREKHKVVDCELSDVIQAPLFVSLATSKMNALARFLASWLSRNAKGRTPLYWEEYEVSTEESHGMYLVVLLNSGRSRQTPQHSKHSAA